MVRLARLLARKHPRASYRGAAARRRSASARIVREQSVSAGTAATHSRRALAILVHGPCHQALNGNVVAPRVPGAVRSGARARPGRPVLRDRMAGNVAFAAVAVVNKSKHVKEAVKWYPSFAQDGCLREIPPCVDASLLLQGLRCSLQRFS